MSYSCKILLDSISETGKRLTTFEITFPRIVLAEFNTHRAFSRNSTSSRAIPFKRRLEAVNENPFVPDRFPVDGKGMQPNRYIDKNIQPKDYEYTKSIWLAARDVAVNSAKNLYNTFTDFDVSSEEVHIHKQIVNRLLEPFQWHTVIVTATEFSNFFKLRTHLDAQYEIKRIADLMYEAYHIDNDWNDNSEIGFIAKQQKLKAGEWHCPLVFGEEDFQLIRQYLRDNHILESFQSIMKITKKVSVARCARISYLTHDGKRDIEKDLELFEKLRTSGHWSPFEHVATPLFIPTKALLTEEIIDRKDLWLGNFLGWKQFRKEFQDENCTNFRKEN